MENKQYYCNGCGKPMGTPREGVKPGKLFHVCGENPNNSKQGLHKPLPKDMEKVLNYESYWFLKAREKLKQQLIEKAKNIVGDALYLVDRDPTEIFKQLDKLKDGDTKERAVKLDLTDIYHRVYANLPITGVEWLRPDFTKEWLELEKRLKEANINFKGIHGNTKKKRD